MGIFPFNESLCHVHTNPVFCTVFYPIIFRTPDWISPPCPPLFLYSPAKFPLYCGVLIPAHLYCIGWYKDVGLGKVPLTNGGFRKLTEVFVNERQKSLIFKMLTERTNRFWRKKLTTKNENETDFVFKNGEFR